MKKMLPIFLLLLTLPSSSTVLGDLAASLPERTFVKVPANASLTGLNMSNPLLYWNDSAVWNAFAKKFQWVGAGGTCCSNGQYYLMTYDEASDVWSIASAPFSGSGHAYDGNAVDPATGIHYFGRYYDAQVHTWNGSTWGTLPNQPWSETTPSLSFFPEINGGKGGLIFQGASPHLAWYDGAKWTSITGGQWGSYNNFTEYNPVHKLVWLGAGNGGDRIHYKLDASLKLTKLQDAPFSLNNSQALHSCDPASGMFIVTDLNNQAWWEFDIVNDTWKQLTGLPGAPALNASEMQAPISDHGVIMYFKHSNSLREIYLYKHAKGTAAEARISPRRAPLEILATPQPFRGRVVLTIPFSRSGTVTIYNAQGKRVAAWVSPNNPAQHLWDATGLPAGIYLVKAVAGMETGSCRMVLER